MKYIRALISIIFMIVCFSLIIGCERNDLYKIAKEAEEYGHGSDGETKMVFMVVDKGGEKKLIITDMQGYYQESSIANVDVPNDIIDIHVTATKKIFLFDTSGAVFTTHDMVSWFDIGYPPGQPPVSITSCGGDLYLCNGTDIHRFDESEAWHGPFNFGVNMYDMRYCERDNTIYIIGFSAGAKILKIENDTISAVIDSATTDGNFGTFPTVFSYINKYESTFYIADMDDIYAGNPTNPFTGAFPFANYDFDAVFPPDLPKAYAVTDDNHIFVAVGEVGPLTTTLYKSYGQAAFGGSIATISTDNPATTHVKLLPYEYPKLLVGVDSVIEKGLYVYNYSTGEYYVIPGTETVNVFYSFDVR